MDQAWTRYIPKSLRNKIKGRDYLQNVISNTGWQFADNIVRMFVGVWVARYLGPEQFGLFNYALAFVAIFASFASLGLEDIVIRDIVREPECKDETLGTAFMLMLVGGAIAFLVAIGLILIVRPDDNLSHWLVSIIAIGTIFQAFTVIDFWFHSQVQAKYLVLARNVTFLACSALKIILIVTGASLIAFAWVYLLELIVGSAGLVLAYHHRGYGLLDWQASLTKAGGLLKSSWPLLFSGIVITVYLRIDQIMLGEMTGSKEVGIYSVAVRLAEIWMFIPMAIFLSVFPAIVEARDTSEILMFNRLQQLYNLMAFLAYAIAIPVTLVANWLVFTLYGEDFSRAGDMLALLIWANMFIYLEIARSAFLSSMNWTKLHFVTVLLGAVLNIILNYLLIPPFGGTGAVIASLGAYWFAAHGSCFLFKPLFKTGTMLTRAMFYPKIW
jgi:O-antigen/teichoic acid export membrane protein